MNENQRIAFLLAQAVCALGDIAGMFAENQQRQFEGKAMAYTENEFSKVAERYGLDHNSAIKWLDSGR